MNNFSDWNHSSDHALSNKLYLFDMSINLQQNVNSTPPDEHSETLGKYYKSSSSGPRTGKQKLLPMSSSVCSSLGSSNYMRETQDSASSFPLCHSSEEKPRNKAGFKRKRIAELKLTQKKRRNKINKKMFALKALIPNSNKVDKVSILDNVISYIKALQLQLKIMSNVGTRLIMQTPNPMSHVMLNYGAANMSHFHMNSGVCGGVQISPLQMLSVARPNALEMLGLMPLSVSTGVPLHLGFGPSGHSVLLPPEISKAPVTTGINDYITWKSKFF